MSKLIARTFAVAVVALGGVSHAAIIIVPDDQPTIQAAIDVAMPGDTIQVRPAVYNEVLFVPETLTNLTIEGLGGRPKLAPLVPPGVEHPEVYHGARGGDFVGSASIGWLEAYANEMRNAINPTGALRIAAE